MQLQVCDSCKAAAPALGPDSAGQWVTGKGSDGWTRVQFVVHREVKPPKHIQLGSGQAFYGQVASKVDLCGKCLQELLGTLLLQDKVALEVPEAGDFVTLPASAIEALRSGKLEALGDDDAK